MTEAPEVPAPKTTAALTDKQRDILRYVVRYYGNHGFYPSIREVMAEFGMASPNGVRGHFKALEAKGYIEWPHDGTSRTVVVPQLKKAAQVAAEELLRALS